MRHNLGTYSSAMFLALVSLSIPSISIAAGPANIVDLSNMFIKIFNTGTAFLVLAAIVIYFWGITGGLFKSAQGKTNGGDLRKLIGWGLVVLFVMVSIWGIVRLLRKTLFANNSSNSSSGTLNSSTINTRFINPSPVE